MIKIHNFWFKNYDFKQRKVYILGLQFNVLKYLILFLVKN